MVKSSWIPDGKVKYLGMRSGKNGGSWVYYRFLSGRPVRITLGKCSAMSRKEAVRRAEEISGNIARYGNPDGNPGGGNTLRNPTLADAWKCYTMQREVSSRQRRQYERYLLPRFGAREIQSVTHADVRSLHAEISAAYPVAANRVISLMSAIVNAAIRDDVYSGPNPAGMIRKNRETPRRRYLDRTEIRHVLEALEIKMRCPRSRNGAEALYLMLLTGARSGNVLSMRWDEVNPEGLRWVIPAIKAKARKEIVLPLCHAAAKLLIGIRDRQRGKYPYVFPHRFRADSHITTVKRLWGAILSDAGIDDCHIHDLRHTYATYQLSAGVDIATVSEMLAHADISTTKRIYAHVIEDRKRAAAEAAEAALLGDQREPVKAQHGDGLPGKN